MADYINRDELLDQLEKALKSIKLESKKTDGDELLGQFLAGELDAISACKLAIMSKKAADVRENVHGEWIYNKDLDIFRCSKCGGGAIRNEYSFCHWCGAYMRGKSE